MGEGELELFLPSAIFGRGAEGEGKDLSSHWDAPRVINEPKKSIVTIWMCPSEGDLCGSVVD